MTVQAAHILAVVAGNINRELSASFKVRSRCLSAWAVQHEPA